MKKLIAVSAAFAAALACTGAASAAELAEQERSELRQRAEMFQSQRARNPDFQPGEGRVSPQRADVPPRAAKKRVTADTRSRATNTRAAADTRSRAGKTRAAADAQSRAASKRGNDVSKTAQPETRRQKAAKKVRSIKKIPGAFVRERR